MPRIPKRIVHDARSVMNVIREWEAPVDEIFHSVPKGTPHTQLALPESEAAFAPNIGEMEVLLNGLGGSIRARFAQSNIGYHRYMAALSRYKAAVSHVLHLRRLADNNQLGSTIDAAIPASKRRTLTLSCLRWVSYGQWLDVLAMAGMLNESTISGVRNKQYASILTRMRREYIDRSGHQPMVTAGEQDQTAPSDTARRKSMQNEHPGVISPWRLAFGGVYAPTHLRDAVLSEPLMDEEQFRTVLERSGVVMSCRVGGRVRDDIHGRLFVNCVFEEVTFNGEAEGAAFIDCEFNNCRLYNEARRAEHLFFKGCAGELALRHMTLTGFEAHQCDGLKVSVRNAGLRNSMVSNGWVECLPDEGDGPEDLATDQRRRMPRTVSGSLWVRGGLDFDRAGMEDSEIRSDNPEDARFHRGGFLAGLTPVLIPSSIANRYVIMPTTGVGLGDLAARLWFEDGATTREIAEWEWEMAPEEPQPRRTRRDRTASEQAPASGSATAELDALVAAGPGNRVQDD